MLHSFIAEHESSIDNDGLEKGWEKSIQVIQEWQVEIYVTIGSMGHGSSDIHDFVP